MRIIYLILALFGWTRQAYGFLVTAGYPAVCAETDFAAVLHVEKVTGRGTWEATVLQQVYGIINEAHISLLDPCVGPEPDPGAGEEVIMLGETGAVNLVPGTTYLAFLKMSDSGIAYIPASLGIDSYYVVNEGRVENLRRDVGTGLRTSMLLSDAVDDIRIQVPEQKARQPRTLASLKGDKVSKRNALPKFWKRRYK